MLHYIKGEMACKLPGSVVIETGGIGFEINVPSNSRLYLVENGMPVQVYTYMNVREDDISLFGFDDQEGVELFKKLLTVNGVGAKAAMAILSAMPALDVKKAIIYEDVNALTKAQGIGKKTAMRIVLDLKDKIKDLDSLDLEGYMETAGSDLGASKVMNNNKNQAIEALTALGYSKAEAEGTLAKVGNEDLSVEEYIKLALKNI